MRNNAQIFFGPFRMDLAGERLWRDSAPIALTPKGFALLRFLAEHPGQLLTKQDVLKALWSDALVTDSSLYVCIREVRKALGDHSDVPRYIETMHRRGYRFIGSISRGRAQCGSVEPPTWLVGRDGELAKLEDLLQRAVQGERQVVFVTGEPGIGKTALTDAFLRRAAAGGQFWAARGQCCAHHGPGEAFAPLLESLGELDRGSASARLRGVLARYAPTWLAELLPLSSVNERNDAPRPASSRERMLRELNEAVEALTAETPLVLVLEDLHWSDYATVDQICSLAQRRGRARLLFLVTYRPAELIVRQHPLRAVKQELQAHGQCQELPLGLLAEEEVAEYLTARFPEGDFADEMARLIHQQTDGNPLFMVNMVDYGIARGWLRREGSRWEWKDGLPAAKASMPDSILGIIERQADQLSMEEQCLLEGASVAGVQFNAAAVSTILDQDAECVEDRCEGLAARQQFLRRDELQELPNGSVTSRYRFTHALYQNAFYQRIPAARRIQLHRRIVAWGESSYGDHAGEIAAELAVHAEQGRDFARAVSYHHQAATRAARITAHWVAADHARRGLDLLNRVEEASDRDAQELGLLMILGFQLQTGRGFAALGVEEAFARARELSGRVPAGPQLGPILLGLWSFNAVRAANRTALDIAEQFLQLAQKIQDPMVFHWAYNTLGMVQLFLGELAASRAHLEEAAAFYDPEQQRAYIALYGQDPKVTSLAFGANGLWLLGDTECALAMSREAVALARQSGHAYSLALALYFAAVLHQRCGQPTANCACAEELLRLAEEHGFLLWSAGGTVLRGRALAEQGALEEGITDIQRGFSAWRSTGAIVNTTYYLALLADTLGAAGRLEEGLAAIAEAIDLADETGEQFYAAELYRIKGELLRRAVECRRVSQTGGTKASPMRRMVSSCFRKAITLARQQGAKALERRAAMSVDSKPR